MLWLCALLNFTGMIVAFSKRSSPGNPFQLFFVMWFVISIGLLSLSSTFYPTSFEFGLMLLGFCSVYFVAALMTWFSPKPVLPRGEKTAHIIRYRKKALLIAQIFCTCVTPLVYKKATELADGNVFSVAGYIMLRRALTDDMADYGALGYILPVAYALSAINLMRYFDKQIGFIHVLVSLAVSVFLAFLGTGRTYFLLLGCMTTFPLIITHRIGLRGIVVFIGMLAGAFALVTALTAKGVDVDVGVADNIPSILQQLRIYIFSPSVAMSYLVDNLQVHTFGQYTFRFFFAVLNKIGLEVNVVPMSREFVSVPDEANVYTVMDPYYRDFSVFGVILFAAASAALHMHLYNKMRRNSGAYAFIYSALMFALVMQFFADMYMSLLSFWVQISFWFFTFVKGGKVEAFVPMARRRRRIRFRRAAPEISYGIG